MTKERTLISKIDREFTSRFSPWEQGTREYGIFRARDMLECLKQKGLSLPQPVTFLGLGAGIGTVEMGFAEGLGIKTSDVTLLDPVYSPEASLGMIVKEKYPDTTLVDSGLFAYIEEPPQKRFSVVSAINMEFIFFNSEATNSFVSGMPKLVKPGGFFYSNVSSLHCFYSIRVPLKEKGFILLNPGQNDQIYHFKGN